MSWHFIKKDLLRHARDPLALILWAAIPLAVAILMRAAFGGDASVPQATLVIADQDGSMISQILRTALGAGPLEDLIHTEEADSAAAVKLAQEGKVSAALFIPPGFGKAYLDGGTPTVTLLRNPSQAILPGIVEEVIAVIADGGFYLRELFGDPISTIRALARSDSADIVAEEISAGIQTPMERVGGYLFPPVLTVVSMDETEAVAQAGGAAEGSAAPSISDRAGQTSGEPGEVSESDRAGQTPGGSVGASGSERTGQPSDESVELRETSRAGQQSEESPGFLGIFFPGILTMSMLFLGQALAVDLWAEHKLGTFRRLATTVKGVSGLVLGKVLAGTIIFWLIFELLLLLGRYAFRIDLERIHFAAIYSAACGFGVLAALHLVMVLARSENGGTILCSLVVMPLVFLGGSFFPFETLSPTMRAIGMATPNGQILVQIKRIVSGGSLDAAVWITPVVAIALGFLFTMLAARGARRRFLGAS